MDRGPRGSWTGRWEALTFDYHSLHRFDWRKYQTAGVLLGLKKINPFQKVSSIRMLLCWAECRNDAISGLIFSWPSQYHYILLFIVTLVQFWGYGQCDNRPPGGSVGKDGNLWILSATVLQQVQSLQWEQHECMDLLQKYLGNRKNLIAQRSIVNDTVLH